MKRYMILLTAWLLCCAVQPYEVLDENTGIERQSSSQWRDNPVTRNIENGKEEEKWH